MMSLDPETERAVRTYIARLPPDLPLEHAILYGSRARGNHRADSDADLALVLKDRAQEWLTLAALSDLAVDIFWDIGIFVQPVPISSRDWADPDGYVRPAFLRRVAREGILL